MNKFKNYFIFVTILLTFNSILYARPDLKLNSYGNDIYNSSDNASNTAVTVYDTVCGKYSGIPITIQNDNGSDDEIYRISITKPSNDWDYYIQYQGKKYTGTWATEWISKGNNDNFSLYVKPPDSTSAKTYTFKVTAQNSSSNTDSVAVYFNVIKKETFDIMLLTDDNLTVGAYIYSSDNTEENYQVQISPYEKHTITFKVKNRGNKLGNYNLKAVSYYYDSDTIKFYSNNGEDITNDIFQSKSLYLDNGSTDTYSMEINGEKIKQSGALYLKVYDSNNILLDSITVNIAFLNPKNNIYKMPYVNDNGTSFLFIVNTSDKSGTVTVTNTLDNDNSTNYSINEKALFPLNITKISKYNISSDNIVFAPFIIKFDNHFNIIANIIPVNIDIKGKELILPLLTQGATLGNSRIYITNFESSSNSITIYLYSYTGDKISESNHSVAANGYKAIDISELISSNGTTEVYWAKIEGTKEFSAYLVDSILNSYISYYGFSLKQ